MKQLLEWTIIGAGPTGIASVGKLLDAGVKAKDIMWIDPQFKVGDFGRTWHYVNSNTPVEHFLKFYQDCQTFGYDNADYPSFVIDKIPPAKNCLLLLAAEPLTWITEYFCKQVNVLKDHVTCLTPINHHWQLQLSSGKQLQTKKIILAIGLAITSSFSALHNLLKV